jgi:hypothetical protein
VIIARFVVDNLLRDVPWEPVLILVADIVIGAGRRSYKVLHTSDISIN